MKNYRLTSFNIFCALAISGFYSISPLAATGSAQTKENFSKKPPKLFLNKDLKRGKHGHRGYQGPQGGPGTPGAPGAPGAPGQTTGTSFISAQSGAFSRQPYASAASLIFDESTVVSDGSGNLTLGGGGAVFTIQQTGYYEVTFGAVYDPLENTQSGLALNLEPVPGTIVITSSQNSVTANEWAPFSVIIRVTTINSTLNIQNISGSGIALLDSTLQGSTSAFITITKLTDL